MSKNQNIRNDFHFFSEVVDVKKGKSSKEMVVVGKASDTTRDADNEVLDPDGFDFVPLMESGFINWHHQRHDPGSFIGEPIDAYVKNREFFIATKLYDFSPKAISVYNLIKAYSEGRSTRRIAYSIEGNAKERLPHDKLYVSKAVIHGAALTHLPKNKSSFVDVIKGCTGAWCPFNKGFTDEQTDFIILDFFHPITNQVVSIYNSGKIIIGSKTTIDSFKAVTTGSIAAATKEDVESDYKDLEFANTVEVLKKAFDSKIFDKKHFNLIGKKLIEKYGKESILS